MCEFISWIEYEEKNYFLTSNDLNTKEGRELRKFLGEKFRDDIYGHGAIRHYYPELKNLGMNRECIDFSSPSNFPKEIVREIKNGNFYEIGICPDILTNSALKIYNETRDSARKIYSETIDSAQEICIETKDSARKIYSETIDSARKIYSETIDSAQENYDEIMNSALKIYNETIDSARKIYNETYDETRNSAQKIYNETIDSALKIYDETRDSARKICNETIDSTFWKLATKESNRVEVWK